MGTTKQYDMLRMDPTAAQTRFIHDIILADGLDSQIDMDEHKRYSTHISKSKSCIKRK